MRWLRGYLLFCGILLNLLLAALLVLEQTASEPFLRKGIERVLVKAAIDHPRLQPLANHLTGASRGPALAAAPVDPPFRPVPIVIDDHPRRQDGRVLRVGAGMGYATIGEAAKAAGDGDTILIEPGRYAGGTAIWRANDLLIKGSGGMAVVDAKGKPLPQDKAIWVIKGDNARVENIEFTGAVSGDGNGAGIRLEGTGLQVVNCYFHDNQEGILTSPRPESEILIEHSEFARNGHPSGQAHNLYIGDARRLIFRFNHVHHAIIGSNLKSRARENIILHNRIMDYADGRVNYSIDLSNGGVAYVIGNVMEQGPNTENYHLLTYAPEGVRYRRNELYVVHNTFVNDRSSGQFIRNNSHAVAHVYNNLFVGAGTLVNGDVAAFGNVIVRKRGLLAKLLRGKSGLEAISGQGNNRIVDDAGLRDRNSYDYHLLPDSPAIDAGMPLEAVDGISLSPRWQYRHPRQATRRITRGRPDAGAFEG